MLESFSTIFLHAWLKEDSDHSHHSKLESSGDQQSGRTPERTEKKTVIDQSPSSPVSQDNLSGEGQPSQDGIPVPCNSEEEDEIESKQEEGGDDNTRKYSPLKPQEAETGSRFAQGRERERERLLLCSMS